MRDDFDDAVARKAASQKRQQDFEDLQHEYVGVQAGRQSRFLNEADDRSEEARQKKRARDRFRRTFAELMRDPEYERLHIELGNVLGDAESEADAVMDKSQRMITETHKRIAHMEATAARATAGRVVFRYADGSVVYADDVDVAPDMAAGIIWPEDAPSAEVYFTLHEHLDALSNSLQSWTVYRFEVLGSIRDRYDNDDAPMEKDELKQAIEEIDAARPAEFNAEAAPTFATSPAEFTPKAFPIILSASQ